MEVNGFQYICACLSCCLSGFVLGLSIVRIIK